MTEIPSTIETYRFSKKDVQLYVPSKEWIHNQHTTKLPASNPPYWAQVWPAAKALCELIASDPLLVKNKNVMEIAAGLGLPSLLAAQFATSVCTSDIEEQAVQLIQASAAYNQLQNLRCSVLNWNNAINESTPDVLLLSDINYEPASFDALYNLIKHFIEKEVLVLLSTPQRLVAKSFIERLQPWCIKTYNIAVDHNSETVFTSVWLLASTQKHLLLKDKSKL